ncbi:MAG TPA: hypothetical protein VFY56_00770 [Propionibacteriaceae bacterium]|nr:hypothetical protein [Propionibacteriaceae bacterium]
MHAYRDALTPPPPPEPELAPVPRALQNRRRQLGLNPYTGQPVDPFMIVD